MSEPFQFDRDEVSRLVIGKAQTKQAAVTRLAIGLTWTTCRTRESLGFAMSPGHGSRVLEWPGTMRGREVSEVANWLSSPDPFAATVGLAAANAAINAPGNALMEQALPIAAKGAPNLAVFTHFLPELRGKRSVIIGRYPGLDACLEGLDVKVLELAPQGRDLPASAAADVLPEADWVFITATSLINKTFHRLAELSRNATSVLMGPSCPWLREWAEFGIDYVAGVQVADPERAEEIAMEGGGTRLFGEGVRYALAAIAR